MTGEHFVDDQGEISKSQIKRELQALRDLGKVLVNLTLNQLDKIPMSPELRDALIKAKNFRHKALKRQLQHIGVLLRNEDAEAIRQALEALRQPDRQQVKELHQLEQWRTGLIAGDQQVLNDIIGRYSDLDRQYLLQLVRNVKKEQEQNKPPKSARALFQYLKALKDE